jgi:hypothetical protein
VDAGGCGERLLFELTNLTLKSSGAPPWPLCSMLALSRKVLGIIHLCGAPSPRRLRLGPAIAHQLNEDGHNSHQSWRQGASDSGALARAHYFLGCLAIHSRDSFWASVI